MSNLNDWHCIRYFDQEKRIAFNSLMVLIAIIFNYFNLIIAIAINAIATIISVITFIIII